MNVALQISGQLRYFKTFYEIFKFQLLDNVHPDIFVSTWKSNKAPDIIPEGTIDDYIKLYHPIEVEVNDFEHTCLHNRGFRNLLSLIDNSSVKSYRNFVDMTAMFFKRYKSNQLRKKYSKKYDIVIIGRSDLHFGEPLLYEHLELAKDCIIIPMGADFEYGICDVFAFGPPELMNTYCNLYRYIPLYVSKNIWYHPEHILKYHLQYHNVPVKRISYNINLWKRRMT